MNIKIKYHNNVAPIEILPQGDWYDLRAAETVHLEAGEFRMISLGVSMKLPDGYEAHIIPRSSTFARYGILLANSMGLIDNSYSGTNDIWRFPAYATRSVTIEKNTRICQFRLVKKQDPIEFLPVDELDPVDRGGFGSSGV